MNFFSSIKFRLTRWYMGTMAVTLLVIGIGAFFLMSYNLHRNLDESLKVRVSQLRSSIEAEGRRITIENRAGDMVWIYWLDGSLAGSSDPSIDIPDIYELVKRIAWYGSAFHDTKAKDGQELRLFGDMIQTEEVSLVVVVAHPTAEITGLLVNFAYALGVSVLAVILFVGVTTLVLTSRVMKPVEQMTRAAQEISVKDLSRRIAVGSDDELGRLGQTLNSMIERLEEAFDRQRQFTADASHELRTPLSIIEAESTLALSKERNANEYQKSLELVAQETSYMAEIINKMLFLARSEAGKEPLNLEEVNLRELFAELSPDMEVLCRDKGLDCNLGPFDEAFVQGDVIKLKQMFLNLWNNAVRYTASGRVATSAIRNGKTVTVTVVDTGVGIAPEHLPHIFERFYRVDNSRSRADGGSGLGLVIARHIAELHGGRIEVESRVGEGTTFAVILPLV